MRLSRLNKAIEAQLGPSADAFNTALANAKGQVEDGTNGMSPPSVKKARKSNVTTATEDGSPTAAKGRKRKLDDVEYGVSAPFAACAIHLLLLIRPAERRTWSRAEI